MSAINLRSLTMSILERRKQDGEAATITPVDLLAEAGLDAAAPTLCVGPEARPQELKGLTGVQVGRFTLGEELGRGGMGRVSVAHDPVLLRTVAVKQLHDPEAIPPESLAQFVAEAQITAQLDHPNIVPVYELGLTEQGQVYIVLKRVQGSSLREVLLRLARNDPAAAFFSPFRLLMCFILVCNAVAYAHKRGVLHRDLKPENIMLGENAQILVMDWGVARVMDDAAEELKVQRAASGRQTLDGSIIGTPGYMSPEQTRGELHRLDARSDIWSLGAILYEILTQRHAYPATDPFACMRAVVAGPPEDPRLHAEVNDAIADVCMKALAHDPAQRFASAEELAAGVVAYLDGVMVGRGERRR